jgi:LacI family transcriptional regulator
LCRVRRQNQSLSVVTSLKKRKISNKSHSIAVDQGSETAKIPASSTLPKKQVRANIEHVAELAGVSIKTVSRVFNNEPNVAKATRVRVQAAIATLGYIPNHSARSLAARNSQTLGLMYDNPSPNYIQQVQRGALQSCQEAGYDLLLHPSPYGNKAIGDEIISLHRRGRIDGVILTPPLSDMIELTDALAASGVPTALISPAELRADMLQVVTDDRDISIAMTRTLYALGHRRIAFIAGHPEHRAVGLRLEGYSSALFELGLPMQKEYIAQGYNTFESGEAACAALLTLPVPPTAIFAANDDMAAGVMRTALKFGVSIPSRLSVVGFDDIPLANQVWPALSTVRQPIEAMSAKAVQLLISHLRGESDIPMNVMIKSELVLRGTTG